MERSTDAVLVRAAQYNPEDFGLLYEKYAERVFHYFYFHVNCRRDVAEDLRQETFLKAFTKIASFEFRHDAPSYLSYLLSIGHNLLVNYYRDERAAYSLEEVAEQAIGVSSPMESVGTAHAIAKALEQLPFAEKEIFLLRYEIQLSIAEIARAIQKTENAVKLMLCRTRKRLSTSPLLQDMMNVADFSAPMSALCSAAA